MAGFRYPRRLGPWYNNIAMSFILRAALAVLLLCAASAVAQPSINAVYNAASYQVQVNASNNGANPIAQGAYFVILGSGLGPSAISIASSLPFQTSQGGTSVSVTSGGTTVPCWMYYSSAGQVAGIVPSSTPVGAATITVTFNGQTSKPANINVVKFSPGIFTANAAGSGMASAGIQLSATSAPIMGLATPAHPSDVVVLYGTGFGPISGDDSGPPNAAIPSTGTVSVIVGGKTITPVYAGRNPQSPGLDQIDIVLPADVPLGCYTPGVVTVNNIPSNDFTISTAAAGSTSCVHPFGLSQAAEATLDAGGTVNVGVFAAIGGAASGFVAEGAGGLFDNANAAQLYNAFTTLITFFHVTYYPAPTGSCVVYDEIAGPPPASPIPQDFTGIGGKELQPAAFITLSGPGGISQNILRAGSSGPGSGYLWAHLVSQLDPAKLGQGTFTLSGAAGPDIAAFTASTAFPPNLTWKNMGNLNAPFAANGVTITWDGGPATGQPNVNIFGSSSVFNNADPSKNRGKSFSCIVDANAKQFAVPASITSQLPVPGAGEYEVGSLGMSIGGGAPFNATLTNGTPLDGSFFGFGEAYVNNGSTFSWK